MKMSKTSEAETLRNQIKYLTDLINNAKKRKQGPTVKPTPSNAPREVKGHQQRTRTQQHVNNTRTELQRSGTAQQKYNTGHNSEDHAQNTQKQGKYVWKKHSGILDQPQSVCSERKTVLTQPSNKLQVPDIQKSSRPTLETVPSNSNSSSVPAILHTDQGANSDKLTRNNQLSKSSCKNVPNVSGSSVGNCANVRNTTDAEASDQISLHSKEAKPTMTLKAMSFLQNIPSNIVPSSSPSTADVSSSGLKSIRSQLVHKLKKDSVTSSVRSRSTNSSVTSCHTGKSSTHATEHTKQASPDTTKSTSSGHNIPSLMNSQVSSQKSVLQSSSETSTKKVSSDKNVILLTVDSQSPEPVEQSVKKEKPQTQEKLSVIPSFLKNHLKRKMSKDVESNLTSQNIAPKAEPECKIVVSAQSLPTTESQSSIVPSTEKYTVCSKKEPLLPQSRRHIGASIKSEKDASSDKIFTDLPAVETISMCQGLRSSANFSGNKKSAVFPHSDSSISLMTSTCTREQPSSSPGFQSKTESQSKYFNTKEGQSIAKVNESKSISANSEDHSAFTTVPQKTISNCDSASSSILLKSKSESKSESPTTMQKSKSESKSESPTTMQKSKSESKSACSTTMQKSKSESKSACSTTMQKSKSESKSASSTTMQKSKSKSNGASSTTAQKSRSGRDRASVTVSQNSGHKAKSNNASIASPLKSSQQCPNNSASSFPSKTGITEKLDSRKDTVLQLSEKLAKTQAEIKRMTRNITNSQVTMKSIAAIKKEKSLSAKPVQETKTQKQHKMYRQDSSKGQKFPFKKAHTFPFRNTLGSPNFQSRQKRPLSKSHVVFDKKYSLNKKPTKMLEKNDTNLPRSAVTPSKAQVVAKVIKSKYKLRKVTSGVRSPPPRHDNKLPMFPSRSFPSIRGHQFSKTYHNYRSRGSRHQYEYGFYQHMDMRRHHSYPVMRNRPGYMGQYTRHGYPGHSGDYPVTGRGFHQPYIPHKVKRSHHMRSKVIFDKKYVLKRLQHDRSSPSIRFKSDKRRQTSTVPSIATGMTPGLKSRPISTLNPAGTPGKSNFVVINGMLYKSSSKSLIKTSPVKMSQTRSASASISNTNNRTSGIVVKKMESDSMKVVTVRGVQFQMDAGGKTLRRVQSTSSSQGETQQSRTTVKRLDIGGMTYIRNSQGTLERVGSANTRVVANRVINKSIAAATARSRKINKRNKLSKQYCLFYNRFGKCKRGDKCSYIHDPDKVAICTRFLRGTCQMTGCPFSHKVVKEKMPVCSYFLRGVCNRDDCPYLHVKVNKNASVCQNFLKGFCPLGEKCKKQHTLECAAFSKSGHCPAGRSCPLIHKKDKPRKKRSVVTSIDKQEQHTLKRTVTESGLLDEDQGIPFKQQKLPTYISLGSSPVIESSTSSGAAIQIKPKL